MKYYLIKIGIILRKILPDFLASILTITFVNLAYPFLRNRKKIIKNNLINLKCFENRLLKETFVNFALDFNDFLSIPSMSVGKIKKKLKEVCGISNLEQALALNKGVILVNAHLGNWNFGGCLLASLGYKTVAVTESAEGRKMFTLYDKIRSKTGMEIIKLEDKECYKKSAKSLREGKILVLLGDRDITKNGIEVNFLGVKSSLPKGPAILSLRTGAPIVTAYFVRENNGYKGIVEEPIKNRNNVEEIIQEIAERLGRKIKEYATQWYVFDMKWE